MDANQEAEIGKPLIVFVPGKNPKPAEAPHRAQLLRCLLEGMRRAGKDQAHRSGFEEDWFEVLAWNEMFYLRERDIADEQAWVDRLLSIDAPTRQDRREAHAWKTRFAWVLYSLADKIPLLIPLIANEAIRSTMEEILQYFRNVDGIGQRIRKLLKDRLINAYDSGRPVLLIGHSMGSVIAYDALWELSHEQAETRKLSMLLTLGSPLGLKFVQKRLLGADKAGSERYPANITRWVNIAAMGELTALDREFSDDYQDMVNLGLLEEITDYHKGVYNYYRDDLGLNVHRSYGYLVNPVTGRTVADWLTRALGHEAPARMGEPRL